MALYALSRSAWALSGGGAALVRRVHGGRVVREIVGDGTKGVEDERPQKTRPPTTAWRRGVGSHRSTRGETSKSRTSSD